MTLIRWARMSSRSCCRAGRSVDPPEKPPSSYRVRTSVQPAWGLTTDIGLRRIILGIERVEVLIEARLGRDPGINGAADGSSGGRGHDFSSREILSRRPKNRGPFQLVPVMAKATLDRLS